MPPLFQTGIIGHDAPVSAIEASHELVGLRVLVVQRHSVTAVDLSPGNRVDPRAVLRNPPAHDLPVGCPPENGIRLPQARVAHEAEGICWVPSRLIQPIASSNEASGRSWRWNTRLLWPGPSSRSLTVAVLLLAENSGSGVGWGAGAGARLLLVLPLDVLGGGGGGGGGGRGRVIVCVSKVGFTAVEKVSMAAYLRCGNVIVNG